MRPEIDIRRLDELSKRLDKAARMDFARYIKAAATNTIFRTSEYPPAPAHEPDRWYERHFGPRWARVDGSIGGRPASERLKDRWYSKIESKGVRIGNRASYAEYVHGEKQNRLHTRTGWLKLGTVARDEVEKLEQIIARKIAEQIAGGR